MPDRSLPLFWATGLVGLVGGFLASKVGWPLPWMVGSLLAIILVRCLTPWQLPEIPNGRKCGQWIIGVGIGIFGYILRKLDFPLSPVLLGFILGGLMEQNLRRALSISNGALEILWASPITMGVWVLTAIMLLLPVMRIWRKRSAQRRALADA